jgi:hypothetical protein
MLFIDLLFICRSQWLIKILFKNEVIQHAYETIFKRT